MQQRDSRSHVDHWYQISAIDVLAHAPAAAIVALGDSITDGHGATTNGNDRWTDVLAARLQVLSPNPKPQPLNPNPDLRPQTPDPIPHIGVANAGIGGNHLLTDGLGPNVLARFDRDVLAQAGVRYLIVFEGVNDLGGLASTAKSPPPTTTPSSPASSPPTSRSSPAPTPRASASSEPPSPPTSAPATTTPAP